MISIDERGPRGHPDSCGTLADEEYLHRSLLEAKERHARDRW
jgi:hypothetical protein